MKPKAPPPPDWRAIRLGCLVTVVFWVLVVVVVLLLVGCGNDYSDCPQGMKPQVRSEFIYGFDIYTGQYKPMLTTRTYCIAENL